MPMRRDESRRGAGRAEIGSGDRLSSRVGKPLACLALCLLATGCGGSLGPMPGLSARSAGTSIAFESIDGPPRETSQILVRDLDEEAAALRIAVVPAGGEASYRLRGYLAAHAQGATTSIAWAWDIYDAELHRAFRLSGEERSGPAAGRGAEGAIWAAADEALLRRIAHAGMEQLAGFMASPPAPATPPAAPAPERSGQAVASRDDIRSEGAGSLRGETLASFEPALIPLPQRRPAQAGWTGADRLADAAADR
jgi:hypothetical protein